jgi:hypothetical protein
VSISGCASGSANAQVGYSSKVETSDDGTDDSSDFDDAPEGEVAGADHDQSGPNAEDEEYSEGSEDDVEPPEAHLARTALHRASPPENHLGLAMVLYQRASDLPWLLAIENRSPKPVELAALPELLELTITPQEKAGAEGEEKSKSEPQKCGGDDLPKKLEDDDRIELRSGELVFHTFDPRDLCEDDSVLSEGARVEAQYGFPLQTKKLWKNGKLTTVEAEQKDPFVAGRKSETEEFVPLKHLQAEPFVLGMTYPLSNVSPLSSEEEQTDEQGTQSGGAAEPPPPPPLTLSISPLGTSKEPEGRNVSVTIKNTSGKSMRLFVRRELITYEVVGPNGAATCRMHPSERAPDQSAFNYLSAGSSTTLATRLAEACPQDTWDTPGTYSVSARFDAEESGSEHEIDAFVGTGVTTKPARLVVPGDGDDGEPKMRIVSSRPPQ